MPKAKGGLGKGLEALFVDNNTDKATISTLLISEIEPNREQPRKIFNTEALANLSDSIKQHGVLQPLVVRPILDGTYQLVAGERRWRAARMAGLSEVPVVIKDLTDAQSMELALIENLQREDLNVIEEANGYRELMDNFGFTQEMVSSKVGKSRSVIANALRLLNLPDEVQEMVQDGKLSTGHVKGLLALEDGTEMLHMAQEILKKGLSVRQVEALMRKTKRQKQIGAGQAPQSAWDNSYFAEVQLALSQCLSRKVKVEGDNDGKKGKLIIEFYDTEDLKNIVANLAHETNEAMI